MTTQICQHLFHVFEALSKGYPLPYDVPFRIRSQFDTRYGRVSEKMREIQRPMMVAKWISTLEGQVQGTSLVICLEYIMVNKDQPLVYCDNFFRMATNEIEQLQTLKHVDDEEMANFLATYIRTLRQGLHDPDAQSDGWLLQAVDFLSRFWGLCTHLNDSPAGRLAIFGATIAKLEVHDIPCGLWVFAAIAKDYRNNSTEWELCEAMEVELGNKTSQVLQEEMRWVLTAMVTARFLISVGVDGFSEVLHPMMVEYCGTERRYEVVWQALRRADDFERHRECLADAEKELEGRLEEWRREYEDVL
ncbi:MAG: hypothetical protein Q9173_002399 [Seirophora scorigena]